MTTKLLKGELISSIKSITGWSLAAISDLDITQPKLAGHFLRASNERRQVIAAYLSTFPVRDRHDVYLPQDVAQRGRIADLLLNGTHQQILKRAFGEIPRGFRGALGRSGSQPHLPKFYKILRRLLQNHRRPELGKTIQRMNKIDLPRLVIACTLPHELLHPEMIEKIRDRANARDVAAAVKLLREHALNPEAFDDGLRRLRRHGQVREHLEEWLLRCRFPPSPVPQSRRYVPIMNGQMLTSKALEYRNCSRGYALDLLEGKASLAEYHGEGGSVIVMLVRQEDEWLLDGIYARRNGDVDDGVQAQVVDYLRLKGIFERGRAAHNVTPFASLRRLLPRGMWLE